MRVPELVRALEPLVGKPVNPKEIFRLIGEQEITPCGYIHRIPVFDIAQLSSIASLFKSEKLASTIIRGKDDK